MRVYTPPPTLISPVACYPVVQSYLFFALVEGLTWCFSLLPPPTLHPGRVPHRNPIVQVKASGIVNVSVIVNPVVIVNTNVQVKGKVTVNVYRQCECSCSCSRYRTWGIPGTWYMLSSFFDVNAVFAVHVHVHVNISSL